MYFLVVAAVTAIAAHKPLVRAPGEKIITTTSYALG
jgi:hypothetical protein